MAVRRERRVERDAEEPVLRRRVHPQRGRDPDGPAAGVPQPDLAGALDPVHPAVRRHREGERIARVVAQHRPAPRDGFGRPANARQQMAHEGGVVPRLGPVAQIGVEGAPAVELLVPGDRVVGAHRRSGREVGEDEACLVGGEQHGVVLPRVAVEVVDLVGEGERRGQVRGGRVCGVLRRDGDGHRQQRVVAEVGADQPAVPGPVVLGVGGRVHADVSAAAPHEALHRRLLRVVEDVARRVHEGDDVGAGELVVGEDRGVLAQRRVDAVARVEGAQHAPGVGDGRMPEARRAREDEEPDCPRGGERHVEPRCARSQAARQRSAAHRVDEHPQRDRARPGARPPACLDGDAIAAPLGAGGDGRAAPGNGHAAAVERQDVGGGVRVVGEQPRAVDGPAAFVAARHVPRRVGRRGGGADQ